MEDRWLSVDEIAEYLGVSKDTIYTWVGSRNMPGYKRHYRKSPVPPASTPSPTLPRWGRGISADLRCY